MLIWTLIVCSVEIQRLAHSETVFECLHFAKFLHQMERRAQMVINTCTALGEQNPIAMIHDVGAGGLSNALPERTF